MQRCLQAETVQRVLGWCFVCMTAGMELYDFSQRVTAHVACGRKAGLGRQATVVSLEFLPRTRQDAMGGCHVSQQTSAAAETAGHAVM